MQVQTILVDGGYYDCEKEKYFFYLTDHLGNNRVVADEDGNIVETNHYYPFGQTFAESTSQDVQPYKYNGKELDKDFGLNLYDYSARQMEPAIGRFTSVDPLAEKYYNISPYAYVANNPLKHTDPEGKWILNVIGAVASAAIDYGSQVAVNLASGEKNAFTNVSWGSIAGSAVEGAINPIGGVTKSVVKSVAKTTVKTVVKNAAKEGAKGAWAQMIDNVINGDGLTKDLGAATVVSSVTGNMKVTPNGKNAKTTIDKATKKTTSDATTGRVAGTLTKGEKSAVESAKSKQRANIVVETTTSFTSNTINQKMRDEIEKLKK